MKKLTIIITCFLLSTQLMTTSAETSRYSDFAVTPIFPKSQIIADQGRGYFDLLLKPSEEETLQLEITNTGTESMIAHLEPTNGVTRDNGESDYTSNDLPGELIKYPMTSLLSIENNDILIEPKETKMVSLNLKMPRDEFDGVILGGIAVTATTKEAKQDIEEGVGVTSSIRYLVAIQARNNLDILSPQIEVIDAGVKDYHFKPAFYVKLRNRNGLNMSGVKFEGAITQANDGKELAIIKQDNKSILPYSDFDVTFELTDINERLKKEHYNYDLTVEYEGQRWKFKDTIDLTNQDLSPSISTIKGDNNFWFLAAGGLLVFNLILVGVIVRKKRTEK